MAVKKIGIVVKPDPEAIKKADELESCLRSKDIEVVRKEHLGVGISYAFKASHNVFLIISSLQHNLSL